MDLALNNLQRLICHKTQQTKPYGYRYLSCLGHLVCNLDRLSLEVSIRWFFFPFLHFYFFLFVLFFLFLRMILLLLLATVIIPSLIFTRFLKCLCYCVYAILNYGMYLPSIFDIYSPSISSLCYYYYHYY